MPASILVLCAALAAQPTPPTLDTLVTAALRDHPSLRQIEARVREAQAKGPQRRALPDPRFGIALEAMPLWPPRFNATPMTGLQLSITQVIPWPTQLTLAARMENQRAAVVQAQLAEARLHLATVIRATALELVYLDAEGRLTRDRGKLIDRLIQLATLRYRVQKGTLQELLKARLARSQIEDRLLQIARARDGVEAQLNALTGRAVDAPAPAVALPGQLPTLQALAALLERARRHRPLLTVWKRRIAVQRLRKRHARTGFYPDFAVTFGYRYRQDSGMDAVNGMDFWSLGISVRIPLWSIGRTRAAVREAEAAQAREEHAYQDALLQVARELRTARDAITRLAARQRLYDGRILPEARQALQAAIQAYTTGKADFLTVLDHERTLYAQQSLRWQVRVRLAQQWERLRAAVGDPTGKGAK